MHFSEATMHLSFGLLLCFTLATAVPVNDGIPSRSAIRRSALREIDIPFTLDTDQDGKPNVVDLDDDGDGVPDIQDYSPLDAAVSSRPSGVSTVPVVADSLIRDFTDLRTINYGSDPTAEIRLRGRLVLFKFAVPVLGTITSASLQVHSKTEDNEMAVFVVPDNDWFEHTVTFDNANLTGRRQLGNATFTANALNTMALTELPQQGQNITLQVQEADNDDNVEEIYMRETPGKGASLRLAWDEVRAPRLEVVLPADWQLYEDGTPTVVSIKLAQAPTSTVYVTVVTSDTSVGVVDGSTVLTFGPSTWDAVQELSLKGVDDARDTSNPRTVDILFKPLHSTDAFFNGYNPPDSMGVPCSAVRITNLSPWTMPQGSNYSRRLLSGSNLLVTNDVTYQVLIAPVGLSVLRQSGLVTFRPTSHQVGVHTIVIEVRIDKVYRSLHTTTVTVTASSAIDPEGLYVVPGGGTDVEAAGSASNPYNSITYAFTQAKKGDAIFVRGGAYWTEAEIGAVGTGSKPIVLSPLPGEQVRLDFVTYRCFNILPTARSIVIRGFEFDGHADADHWELMAKGFWALIAQSPPRLDIVAQGGGIAIGVNGWDVLIEGNHFHNCYQKAVNIQRGRYVTVRHNVMHDIAVKSLTGGHGIMRQGHEDFGNDDPDANSKYRFDITGNLMFNIEQRIYSWVPWKGYWHFVLDEGKPVLIDETKDMNVKARISNNIVAFAQGTHIRVKSTRNLEVSNNCVHGKLDMPDSHGITDRAMFNKTYFEGMVFKNNAVVTGNGTWAVEMADGFDANTDYGSRLTNNYIAGGGGNRGPVLGVTDRGSSGQLFVDPLNGDFTLVDGIPITVGIQPEHSMVLEEMIERWGIDIGAELWHHDHLRNTQTILDNMPSWIFGERTYGASVLEDTKMAFYYAIVNDTWRAETGGNNTRMEIVLPIEYKEWYETRIVDGQHVNYGTSLIASDVMRTRSYITYVRLGGMLPFAEHDQLTVQGRLKLDGKLVVVLYNNFTPHAGDEFVIAIAERVEGMFGSTQLPPLPSARMEDRKVRYCLDFTS
eukprot:m.110542 g.110542  ORF g.110542 m.110542 type:complete len:1048 (+) comp15369_c0_seq3:42-3185(+)